MLQQPRVPPTGQRQAIEIQIKWKEVLAQKQALLRILSKTTGHSTEKLDHVGVLTQAVPRMIFNLWTVGSLILVLKYNLLLMQDMQRPLYMQPGDAIEYGIIDGIVRPQTDIIDEVMNAEQWDKQAGLVAR